MGLLRNRDARRSFSSYALLIVKVDKRRGGSFEIDCLSRIVSHGEPPAGWGHARSIHRLESSALDFGSERSDPEIDSGESQGEYYFELWSLSNNIWKSHKQRHGKEALEMIFTRPN